MHRRIYQLEKDTVSHGIPLGLAGCQGLMHHLGNREPINGKQYVAIQLGPSGKALPALGDFHVAGLHSQISYIIHKLCLKVYIHPFSINQLVNRPVQGQAILFGQRG